jgi:gamma-butyrobetaine dioxygenase
MTAAVDEIADLFADAGRRAYLGEPVSIAEHMLQTAAAAQRDGASAQLVVAALLHDIGHLLHGMPQDSAQHGVDTAHEEVGERWLARSFPESVTAPIGLHVAAKRYLCGTDPGYRALLSQASRYTLSLQGGPMGDAEARQFAAAPFARQAVLVRRWDDSAKQPGVRHEGLGHFLPLLRDLDRGAGQA